MLNKKINILTDIPKHSYVEPAIDINKDELSKAIQSRRSVRVFTNDPVKKSDLIECLELALLAPTSSNLQPWEFYWIKNKNKKKKLVKYCLNQSAARTAQELIVVVTRLDTWKNNKNNIIDYLNNSSDIPKSALRYYNQVVPLVYTQGAFNLFGYIKKIAIAIIGCIRPIPREPTSRADMRVWSHKTTALACENLMLSLRAYGYDSCPMEGMDSLKIKKLLYLPKSAEISMVIGIGKRAENGVYGKRFRINSDRFIKIIED